MDKFSASHYSPGGFALAGSLKQARLPSFPTLQNDQANP
jgi:hypothetical protein